MAIAITDDHRELQRVARSFLDRQPARQASRALLDAPDESLPPFWDELVGLGWLGLHLPEEHGGSGSGLLELAVVLEELGQAVAPGPFLPTVSASAVVALAGDDEQRRRLLPRLASGARLAAVGLDRPLRREPDGRNAQTNIQVHGGIGYTWEHDGHLLVRSPTPCCSPASSASPAALRRSQGTRSASESSACPATR
jgi:3-oxochol-4-en-24-oyl-CoA dehydrogenase